MHRPVTRSARLPVLVLHRALCWDLCEAHLPAGQHRAVVGSSGEVTGFSCPPSRGRSGVASLRTHARTLMGPRRGAEVLGVQRSLGGSEVTKPERTPRGRRVPATAAWPVRSRDRGPPHHGADLLLPLGGWGRALALGMGSGGAEARSQCDGQEVPLEASGRA